EGQGRIRSCMGDEWGLLCPIPAAGAVQYRARGGGRSCTHGAAPIWRVVDGSLNLADCYVDFRRITSLSPTFLGTGGRVSSLTDTAVKALQDQLFRFWTHREPQ